MRAKFMTLPFVILVRPIGITRRLHFRMWVWGSLLRAGRLHVTSILILIDIAGARRGAEKRLALRESHLAHALELVEYVMGNGLDVGGPQRMIRFRRHLRGAKIGFLQSVAVPVAVRIFLEMRHAFRRAAAAYCFLDLIKTERCGAKIGGRAAIAASAGAGPLVAPHAVRRLEYPQPVLIDLFGLRNSKARCQHHGRQGCGRTIPNTNNHSAELSCNVPSGAGVRPAPDRSF